MEERKPPELPAILIPEHDLTLVENTNKVLHTKVPLYDMVADEENVSDLAMQMLGIMRERNGIGLAANQVGRDVRMFILNAEPAFVCINPRITSYGTEEIILEEGCLSYPGLFVKIKRPRVIRVRFQDMNKDWSVQRFEGMSARVFQHELDHLDGIDFTQRAGKVALRIAKGKVKKKAKRANKRRLGR